MRTWIAAAAILCTGTAASGFEGREDALEAAKTRLIADCAAERFSGVVEAWERGKIIFEHVCGFADREREIPMSADRTFKILSISKSITGVAAMILMDEGRLDPDAPIARYVDNIPAAWSEVTVRQLLNHVSGIPDLTNGLLNAYLHQGKTDHASALAATLKAASAKQAALKSEPGSTWAYNNFGYELLAQAIASASGSSYDEFVKKRIFEPAGMATARVEMPRVDGGAIKAALPEQQLALGYNGEKGAFEPALSYNFVQQGAGAVHAGAADLFALNTALAKGSILSGSMQERSIAEAFRVNEKTDYGFGWMTRRTANGPYLSHSGGTNGYSNEFARTPDGRIALAILSNIGGDYPVHELRIALMEALLTPP